MEVAFLSVTIVGQVLGVWYCVHHLGWLAGLGLLATLYGSLGALLAWLVERQPGMRR